MKIKKLIILIFILLFISQSWAIKGAAVDTNLFNKLTVTNAKYVNWDNGNLGNNPVYAASDYIAVIPGKQYSIALFNRGLAYYDQNKQFVSGKELPSTIITIPSNSYFMRVTPYQTDIDTFTVYQVEDPITPPAEPASEQFKLFLPDEIFVAVGRTIELYNSQVSWTGNINNYHFKWDSAVGKAMERKFSITGTDELIGEYPLSLTIYDNNMNVVTTATSTIKIVNNEITTPKTILTIGDSLTNNKAWLRELRLLSNNQFTMVGTRGTAPLQHEGRSGWSAGTYLTGASYTYEGEGINPFWDGTRFNWTYYKTNTGISPDAVQIYLGTNGMEINPTTNANNIKQIVDYIRQDDANIPIFVVNTLYRGNQNGIGNETNADGYAISKGQWKLEEDRKVFNLMAKLDELLGSYANLHFVPISASHDSEYNFGSVLTPVNPRAVQTELLPIEATHPQYQGYMQMADIMFGVFAKYLNN
jgi:hypothetical protein